MKMRFCYLLLAVLGLILPYAWFLPWVLAHGLDLQGFAHELFSTQIGGFFGMDVVVAAVVLVAFVYTEGRRLRMQRLWLPIAGTFLVGVSFGLPLFLYMRAPYLTAQASASGGGR